MLMRSFGPTFRPELPSDSALDGVHVAAIAAAMRESSRKRRRETLLIFSLSFHEGFADLADCGFSRFTSTNSCSPVRKSSLLVMFFCG
jgi:hypothetical protein